MVRKGGTVNFFGGCAADPKCNLIPTASLPEITLKATFHHTPETVPCLWPDRREKKSAPPTTFTGEAPLSSLQKVLRHMLNS